MYQNVFHFHSGPKSNTATASEPPVLDSRKQDPNGSSRSTTRSCSIQLVNNYGTTITNAYLTLQNANTYQIFEASLANGQASYVLPVTYETGIGADYDYWSASFTDANGVIWYTPNNDRCNISLSDQSTTVQCTIINVDGQPFLTVGVEDGCTFEMVAKS